MDHSYLFFGGCKIVEVLFTSACLLLDLCEISLEETVPLAFIWCISYGLFTVISIGTTVVFFAFGKGCRNSKLSIAMTVSTSVSSLFYFIMGLMNMYELNEDDHLDHIPDEEEHLHAFFISCVSQSVMNTTTALVFLVDTIVQVDLVCQKRRLTTVRFEEGHEIVELEPSDAMEFNCWPCSVPAWCRDATDECASWWRVMCFRMSRSRLGRLRRRRRHTGGERSNDAPPPAGKSPTPPNAADRTNAEPRAGTSGQNSASQSTKSALPDTRRDTLTPSKETKNAKTGADSGVKKALNTFHIPHIFITESDSDDEDAPKDDHELNIRVLYCREVIVE